ncbi:MAG: hypothetical protein JXQ27_03980 [Acidobacteria bacterium]|nr:hypothetical protein [Acidobacteriota bacterium]
MMRRVIVLAFSFCACLSLVCAAIPATERAALIALYSATDGDHWTDNTHWLGAPGTECQWFGVTCDGTGSFVKRVDLYDNNLQGSLPSELDKLTNLDFLNLSKNSLTGSIPVELCRLEHVYNLNLGQNQLSGVIPPEIFTMASLGYLNLEENDFSGEIPTIIGISSATAINLSHNLLTGGIPTEIGTMPRVQHLYFTSNNLVGPLPTEIYLLSALRSLDVSGNQLSGPLSPAIGQLADLEFLNLNHNEFEGNLPSEIGLLTNLETLYVADNHFGGALPSELGHLDQLEYFSMDSNKFTGQIPAEYIHLDALGVGALSMNYNGLYTDDPALAAFLNSRQNWQDFELTQTIAPADTQWTWSKAGGELTWSPIIYTENEGGYEIWHSLVSGGPYTRLGITADKTVDTFPVTDLDPTASHFFRVRTVTEAFWNNLNTVVSEFSPEIQVGPVGPMLKYPAAHVADNDAWWSRLTVVNTGASAGPLWLMAVDATGNLLETVDCGLLAAGAVYDNDIAAIFSAPVLAQDIWVMAGCPSPLAGMVTFGTRDNQTLVTIPIEAAGARKLVFPYVIASAGLGYFTGLTLVNTEVEPAQTVLEAYAEDGTFLQAAAVEIPGYGKYVRLLEYVFGLADPSVIRFVRVRADRPLIGFELFGSYADAGMAGLPAFVPQHSAGRKQKAVSRVAYNEIPDNADYYTGVTVSNLGESDTQLMMRLRDADGALVAEHPWPEPVPSGAQVTREIWNLFDGTVYDDAAWLEITGSQPLMGFELFLSRAAAEPFRFDGIIGLEEGSASQVFPLVRTGPGWSSRLRLTDLSGGMNPFTVSAYAADGAYLGEYTDNLAASGQFESDLAALFTGAAEIAWLRLSADAQVLGSLTYGSDDLRRMGGYMGQPGR